MQSVKTTAKATGQDGNGSSPPGGPEPSDQERQEETSKAAKSALAAQRKAKQLTQAAAAAADPDERQKLLNEALQKEIEAESFGKTAKYLQSGSFQGLIAGGGIGTGIGIGLGTLTGMLVGGVASLVTGGLGSAVGAGVGALKGPFVKPGEIAGEGVSKVSGTLPGWKATDQQKESLEKMIGDAHEQERPSEEDLTALSNGKASDACAPASGQQSKQRSNAPDSHDPKKPPPGTTTNKKPRKLSRQMPGEASSLSKDTPKKTPRKLEIRS